MNLRIKRTKKQELTEQLVIEQCVRIGVASENSIHLTRGWRRIRT
jgi:hypothetical protein